MKRDTDVAEEGGRRLTSIHDRQAVARSKPKS